MIDYKTCDKLLDLLDKGDLKKLRKYISDERNKYYLLAARKALTEYLNGGGIPYNYSHTRAYYDYFKFATCELLLANGYSAYFLKSSEILTRDKKLKAHGTFHPVSTKIMNLYNELVVSQEAVEEIEEDSTGKRDKKILINLKTKEGKIHTFYKDELSFAEKFLGEDVEYSISDTDVFTEGSVCLVKSKKGTGFFLGISEI